MAIEPPKMAWQRATVTGISRENARAKTFRLRLDGGSRHLPGQHYVVRLTAPDGYTAMRSYSVGSSPEAHPEIDLTVEQIDGGEVSTYLHETVEIGDELEVRGPIGRWFVWDGETPALLLGGGAGVVPLVSMLRHARARGSSGLLRLVVSFRSPEFAYFASELAGEETTIVYTRRTPEGEIRPPGRMRSSDLGDALAVHRTAFVCGSSPFANAVTDLVIGGGMSPSDIRIERFGPSGPD